MKLIFETRKRYSSFSGIRNETWSDITYSFIFSKVFLGLDQENYMYINELERQWILQSRILFHDCDIISLKF
jgi:hypothetical protein